MVYNGYFYLNYKQNFLIKHIIFPFQKLLDLLPVFILFYLQQRDKMLLFQLHFSTNLMNLFLYFKNRTLIFSQQPITLEFVLIKMYQDEMKCLKSPLLPHFKALMLQLSILQLLHIRRFLTSTSVKLPDHICSYSSSG